ncbi:MAG: hypothetical protein WD801_12750 [Gemmatimonadaceae bacterium]
MSDLLPSPDVAPGPVLFVCEHGVAKSLLAKLLFEHHARAAGITVSAEARATTPDAALPPWMLEHLKATQLDAGSFTPRALDPSDVAAAARVVSFDLPEVAATAASCAVSGEQWDAIPLASQEFAAAFAAIDARVRALVEEFRYRSGDRGP